jgi:hypothetical protein
MAPSWIFLEGWARVLHCMLCLFEFWIEVTNPCFILSYYPVDKNQVHPRSEKKDILKCQVWSVSGRQSTVWDSPSRNLWHAIDTSQNCQNWIKAYTHFPSNALQVSPSVAHDQIVHSFSSFIVGVLVWAPSRSSSLMLSLPLFNSVAHFFTQCCRKGTLSQVYPWSFHWFPFT